MVRRLNDREYQLDENITKYYNLRIIIINNKEG